MVNNRTAVVLRAAQRHEVYCTSTWGARHLEHAVRLRTREGMCRAGSMPMPPTPGCTPRPGWLPTSAAPSAHRGRKCVGKRHPGLSEDASHSTFQAIVNECRWQAAAVIPPHLARTTSNPPDCHATNWTGSAHVTRLLWRRCHTFLASQYARLLHTSRSISDNHQIRYKHVPISVLLYCVCAEDALQQSAECHAHVRTRWSGGGRNVANGLHPRQWPGRPRGQELLHAMSGV